MMIVPTGGDIDASLRSLRVEFNDLDKQTTTTQVDRGKRLIAIRQLLELKNGRNTHAVPAADGLSPIGWGVWAKENLTITMAQATRNIQYAVDPERMKIRQQRNNTIFRGARTFRSFKTGWANYTDETKRQVAEFVISEVRKEQAQ